jgi:RNA polymerase-binding transcription factor DksA
MKRDEARRALLSRKAALERIRSALSLNVASGEVDWGEIREIDDALRRIQDGTWGRCQSCDRAIGWQRLQAMPETRRCATCIVAAEHLERP